MQLEQKDRHTAAPVVKIVAQCGDGRRATCNLMPDSTVIIGSSASCSLTLSGATVSSMHCLLSYRDGKLMLQQWSSASGTFLNGLALAEEAEVNLHDEIGIGDYVLTIQESDARQPNAAPPSCERQKAAEAADGPPPPDEAERLPRQNQSSESPHSRDANARNGETGDSHCSTPAARVAETSFIPEEASVVVAESAFDDSSEVSGDDDPWSFHEEFAAVDALEDESTTLLRAEIRQLQCELADRDAQLNELLGASPSHDDPFALDYTDAGDPSSLAGRLDELLDELAKNDERVALLEEMLTASEEAAAAEQDERRHLESWVGDIEQRISTRESEWQAEMEGQRKQGDQLKAERDRLERQLQRLAAGSDAKVEYESVLKGLREDNAGLQQQLAEAESARAALQQQLDSVDVRNAAKVQQATIEDALREERARLAQERAELTRKRAEMANKLAEVQQQVQVMANDPSGANDRMRVLRDHLKEIHEQERSQRPERGLMSRIAGLWKNLDG